VTLNDFSKEAEIKRNFREELQPIALAWVTNKEEIDYEFEGLTIKGIYENVTKKELERANTELSKDFSDFYTYYEAIKRMDFLIRHPDSVNRFKERFNFKDWI